MARLVLATRADRTEFLRTTISIPVAGATLVARHRLLARLNDGLRRKLIMVSAPAGFGKTTLLAQWSIGCQFPIAWVSLHAPDDDATRFWAHTTAAVRKASPSLCREDSTGTARQPRVPSAEHMLRALIDDLSNLERDLVLVMDDYHVVNSPTLHRAVCSFVDQLPPRVHLAMLSRADPPIPVARLRALDQLVELRAADLAFSPAEAASFLNDLMNLRLSPDEVAALERRTEGWIVGLQLAALSLRTCSDPSGFIRGFAGTHRDILDFLTEEVLRRQPEAVQAFLLQTSILDRLSGPLCEAVTGVSDAQAMLEALERANLFTQPLDHERRWYRYHPLFADVLRAHLHSAAAAQVPQLQRRAADWYVENHLAREAVGHAMASRDYALAADLLEGNADEMLRRGESATFVDLIGSLPDDLVRDRPGLCLVHARVLANTIQLEAAEQRLRDVERYLASNGEGGDSLGEANLQSILGEVAALRATIAGYRGEVSRAIALSLEALERSPGNQAIARSGALRELGAAYRLSGDTARASKALLEAGVISQRAGYLPNSLVALCELAGTQVVEGQLREAARTYRQAIDLAVEHGAPTLPQVGAAQVGLGRLLYEWNDLEGAQQSIVRGIELAQRDGHMASVVPGYGALARVKQAQGQIDEALDLLRRAEYLARISGLSHEEARLCTLKVRLWLLQGNLEAAAHWAATLSVPLVGEPRYQYQSEYIALARVWVAQGRVVEAADLLGWLLISSEAAARLGSLVKVLVDQAVALQSGGDAGRAFAALRRALSLGQPEGYRRTFLDAGPAMAALLLAFSKSGHREALGPVDRQMLEYVAALWSDFRTAGGKNERKGKDADEEALELLSRRELDVLHLLASGRSPQEMSRELVVSVNTVKTHIKNIYSKLAAHTGTEAVARAKELKLL